MNVHPTAADLSPAERALHEWFEGQADDPRVAQLLPLRRDAFARFSAAGLPHRRVEAYKYSDLRARLRTLPPQAPDATPADADAATAGVAPFGDLDPVRILLVNGRFATSGSCDGLTVEPLLMEGAERSAVGSIVADSADPLALLNTSLFDGGAFVSVAAGARLARPIEIVHRVAGEEPVTVMPRLFIAIGENAQATVIERFVGGPDGAVTNALNEVTIGAGAEVTWVKLQDGGPGETHFGTTFVAPADDAGLSHFMASTGDGYSRSQVFCRVAGTGAKAHFAAAAIAVGGRHVDHTVVVDHVAPGSESRELFRSVAGSRGEAIVQGRIFIAPGAQKTDAQMMSNGLFLDEDAEIVNKPELEIYADDVQGAHGATAGGLDQAMLFYLRSRGVPKAEAERLLVEAFLLQAAAGLADERLRAAVEGVLVGALETAHGGARR